MNVLPVFLFIFFESYSAFVMRKMTNPVRSARNVEMIPNTAWLTLEDLLRLGRLFFLSAFLLKRRL
jgi:hypothetical protein